MDELLTSDEVAGWLRVSRSTLCRWRQEGKGPRVVWLTPSCPRYRRTDVVAWLERVAA
ncbi:helix-turn-helix transcriptional regulator [Granulicoccus sp. GXG6511]|uniref:helix-turn-helix transcriptional regulator n=1 Tax=Granulicoccus sp. GXG6511 TaxID=3381351 RepID=UPI003D7CAF89